ncbi:MAG: response regulator [Desulfobacula sp.]|uniref:response regulator n=1 Tax=Desulfobacula sp. TaxID=2593537 RepID=UPI0025BE2E95|nr:response regulator [Desulfobacula sp.]MCD4718681.1 response regulator [Desulfobacula sp.]
MKKYFSISQVAKICSVNRSTINRWVTSGKIKSYSTPGGHNRILIEDLKFFLEKNQMPIEIDELEEKKTKILIVDDDIALQEYLKIVLSGVFIEIELASDGFEAGIKIIEFKPHLVILDLFMPKADGFQVCKTIKENPSTNKIKVLIMTGYGTKENRDKVISLGADAFLSKPCSMEEIINQVEKLLK